MFRQIVLGLVFFQVTISNQTFAETKTQISLTKDQALFINSLLGEAPRVKQPTIKTPVDPCSVKPTVSEKFPEYFKTGRLTDSAEAQLLTHPPQNLYSIIGTPEKSWVWIEVGKTGKLLYKYVAPRRDSIIGEDFYSCLNGVWTYDGSSINGSYTDNRNDPQLVSVTITQGLKIEKREGLFVSLGKIEILDSVATPVLSMNHEYFQSYTFTNPDFATEAKIENRDNPFSLVSDISSVGLQTPLVLVDKVDVREVNCNREPIRGWVCDASLTLSKFSNFKKVVRDDGDYVEHQDEYKKKLYTEGPLVGIRSNMEHTISQIENIRTDVFSGVLYTGEDLRLKANHTMVRIDSVPPDNELSAGTARVAGDWKFDANEGSVAASCSNIQDGSSCYTDELSPASAMLASLDGVEKGMGGTGLDLEFLR